MAITDTSQTQAALQAQLAASATQANAAAKSTTAPRTTWLDRISGKDPLAASIGSEAVNNLKKALEINYNNLSKEFTDNYQTAIIVLDRTVYTKLAFSAILVAVRERRNGTIVSYYTLMVESTNDGKLSRTEHINGRPVDVIYVAGDAYDYEFIAIAESVLNNEFPNCQLSRCDGTLIPRSFSETPDAAKPEYYLPIADNAIKACHEDLKQRAGGADICLNGIREDRINIVAELDFVDRNVKDAYNQPIATGFTFNMVSEQQQETNSRSLNNGGKSSPIFRVDGAIDLVYMPVVTDMYQAPFGSFQSSNPGEKPTQKYAANAILRSIKSTVARPSPAAIMLAIASAAGALLVNNNYYANFAPKHRLGGVPDKRDIGAVNYEVNIGNLPAHEVMRIDTQSADFNLHSLGMLLSSALRPGLMVSVDVPEFLDQTHYLSFLTTAANGEPNSRALIYKAMNDLTNGVFAQHFNQASEIFVGGGARVLGGTYTDEEGVERDIRELDYLTLLNSKDPHKMETLREWSDAQLGAVANPVERISILSRIIRSLLPSAEFKHFYQRVTFTSDFIAAALISIKKCGLEPILRTPMNMQSAMAQRQTAQGYSAALGSSNSVNNIYNQGNMGNAPRTQQGYGIATRYSTGY